MVKFEKIEIRQMKHARQEILNYIISNPSSQLRKIKYNVGYSMDTVQHHLNYLEYEGKAAVNKKDVVEYNKKLA